MRKKIRNFLQLESASGILLVIAAVMAMVLANSPFRGIYQTFTGQIEFIVNEGLMAVFFLLVGLELKRGFIEDPFSRAADVLLPLAAAIGGMVVPALIYLLFTYQDPSIARGWSTPVATDIAFALGVLTLFGRHIPKALKLFLLSIAIYDDLGAILIIALFYSNDLAPIYFFYAALTVLMLLLLNAFRIHYLLLYLLGGVVLWFMLLKAGIHPTIAGVLTAMLIPELPYRGMTPVHYLEEKLHPYVAFGIMPLFALVNAGFALNEINAGMLVNGVVLGIVCGLFVGKQLGVMAVTWLSIQTTRWARLPLETDWLTFYGVALLCGIGFTMSLFLGTLSFQGQNDHINQVRLGVMAGSILSGLVGAGVLALAARRNQANV